MSSRKRARTNDIPSSAIPAPQSASIEPDVQHLQTLVPMLQSLFRGQLIIMHSLRELAQNRPIAAPSEPAPAGVEPMPAEPQNLVVNPPPSPELEVVLPSPPLIIISDASLDEAVAFPNTPVEETTDPPASPIRGIANLSNSSSGEAVALTDSPV
ncbi:hypothetical protein JHK85_000882 [Glycine max]|uniref:Uncharacterized protein n=1 Tax=Glycine soja TaxID=3848 RepID=A0A0B2QAP6_GLYSO|nr:hypothetical protein JHK85_000882 [Glycine max]KHN18315.1 hypothetical protein glysoja_044923 [Glycine soja]